MEKLIEKLILNSKASQLACIEIHNKPIFPFRYEVCTILNINSWELLLKAFIIKNHPEVKVINTDNTTKPFDECLAFVNSTLGKGFAVSKESIQKIYQYRCNVIHFYQDDIEVLLFSLLGKNILLYHEFLKTQFDIDIADETNLILLPIGFKSPVSPIDFLSNVSKTQESTIAVQEFVQSIVESTNTISQFGLDESILYSFKMSLINENRIKNADIVAAISKEGKSSILVQNVLSNYHITEDENETGVKKVKIEEDSLFKTVYTLTHDQVKRRCHKLFSDYKQNQTFYKIMKSLKDNPDFHKKRYLDIQKQKGGYRDFYTEKVFFELSKHYKNRK